MTTSIDVLVCTYKRVELLARTLDGIEKSVPNVCSVRVVVVDNDFTESARQIVEGRSHKERLSYLYLAQPVQNISMTRNCALEIASAEYIALIDDDEVPNSDWLTNLVEALETYNADVVFAPVLSEYDPNIPEWVKRGRFFEQRARHRSGIRISPSEMRTGNVLIRGDVLMKNRFRFDPALGLSGGEDSDFFMRLYTFGAVCVWCDEAPVIEWVPPSRGSVTWLVKRAFRIGSVISFGPRQERQWRTTFWNFCKGGAFVMQGTLITMLWGLLSKHKYVRGLQRISMGLGIFYGAFNGPFSEYKFPHSQKEI